MICFGINMIFLSIHADAFLRALPTSIRARKAVTRMRVSMEDDRGSIIESLYQTSTFRFSSAEAGERAFAIAYGLAEAEEGEDVPFIYTRVGNVSKLFITIHGLSSIHSFCEGL